MADIVSINKIIDDNYIAHDNTRLSKILEDTGWILLDSTYGDVYYRTIGDLFFLCGAVTPAGENISITLPIKAPRQYVFLLAGGGTYYAKAWTFYNNDVIQISAGTGNSSTSYNLNVVFCMT